jgi:hypothetical protein
MPASSEEDSTGELLSRVNPGWLGNSVWQVPDLEVSRIKSWPSITVMSYRRGGGESIWRSDRHRMTVFLDHPAGARPGRARSHLGTSACRVRHSLFLPSRPNAPKRDAGGVVHSGRLGYRFVLRVAAGAWGQRSPLRTPASPARPLTRPNRHDFAQEVEGGFADRILVESLGTALCIRLARRFVGRLPLPTSKGLSPERLQRVRDYVEAHLDAEVSLTVLADIACLSPYHFSRSFKQAVGLGPSATLPNGGSSGQKP